MAGHIKYIIFMNRNDDTLIDDELLNVQFFDDTEKAIVVSDTPVNVCV